MFMDIILQLSMLLWISIWISLDFYGYPCIDLLRILDPGRVMVFFQDRPVFSHIDGKLSQRPFE